MQEYYKKEDISIYLCDNLELLSRLEDESVNLIYCDILYNTGKKFDDYNDNLGSPEEAIEWYRPRFIQMKRVLSKWKYFYSLQLAIGFIYSYFDGSSLWR